MTEPLLDTSIMLQYSRPGSSVLAQVEANYGIDASPFRPSVCVVTLGELKAFAYTMGLKRQALLSSVLRSMTVINVNRAGVLDAYGWLHDAMHRSPNTVGQNDLWIAACAKASGLPLLTSDKDFLMLPHGCIRLVQVNAKTGVTETTWP